MASGLAVGSELAGYRIERFVARGGMGVVYQATQLSLDRPVALKLLAPELAAEASFRERFLREARLAASLEHPHVLPVHEVGEVDGILFLALRYVEADDLGRLLERGSLAPERARRIVCQLASALQAAHERGLVHRDIKPANVLLVGAEGAEHAYLTDFGLAKPLAGSGLTKTGEFLGSVDFLAPEQIERGHADPRSDIYALGCLLYSCLTGVPPFRREHEAATLWAHINEPPPTGTAFDGVITRALAKNPEERFQSAAELAAVLAGDSPTPLRTVGQSVETTLPVPATPFVGRESELAEVEALLAREDIRLLTLTGPGGTGKTRLAIEAASRAGERFRDGVFWVPLASLGEPGLALSALAQALGVAEQPAATLGEVVAEHLDGKPLLLLLDNAEHLLPQLAAELAPLVRTATWLVTSRERLQLEGEQLFPVPTLVERDAIELFVARARALDPSFQGDGAVAELCVRLDNLPLAIELAAARTPLFTVDQLTERLSQRLDLLKGGRDADPRQQTLRGTIAWSYDLLSDEEQRLFRALSVFAGGCTYQAAEEVGGADPDTLQSLLDKSLVRRRTDGAGQPRYWMLETIREFAAEQLEKADEASQLQERRAAFVLALAERAESALEGPDVAAWLETLAEDQDNVRATLIWLGQTGRADEQLDLVGWTGNYWYTRGGWREGRRWIEEALERSSPERTPRRAKALAAATTFAGALRDWAAMKVYAEEALAIFRELGDEARTGWVLNMLGAVAAETGEKEDAERLFEEAIVRARAGGDLARVALATGNLGELASQQGDHARAIALSEESLALTRELGRDDLLAGGLQQHAQLCLSGGHAADGLAAVRESIDRCRLTGNDAYQWWNVRLVAMVDGREERAEIGARLLGAADATRERLGQLLTDAEEGLQTGVEEQLRSALGVEPYEMLLAEGRSMSLDEAVEVAQSELDVLDRLLRERRESAAARLPKPATRFLGRERELDDVVALLTGEDARLVTLAGPGGTGKTRLALRAAEKSADAFPDSVYWVPLAALRDPSLVATTVAQALEVTEQPGASPADMIVRTFASRRALVLLDNCEHLVEAVTELASELVDRCPRLVLAATSRERLGLRPERVFAVPPMEPPDSERLFVERARAARPDFEADEHVSAICEAVDGLPLAVELAAARVRLLATAAIRERLDSRLSLLATRARDVDARQRTLEATIAWSYDLLDEEERRVLRALSVFAGGCTLEAAEQVVGADLDLLESLLDKSLLRHRVDAAGQGRFWMLETIREFAARERARSDEAESLFVRHVEWVLGFMREAAPRWGDPAAQAEIDRVLTEEANIRLALEWVVERAMPEQALELVGLLGRTWLESARLRELESSARLALELGTGSASSEAMALLSAGWAALQMGDESQARARFSGAAERLESVGATRDAAYATMSLGCAHAPSARALELFDAALVQFERLGDEYGAWITRSNIISALGELALGEPGQARELVARARDLLASDKKPDPSSEAVLLVNLADGLINLEELDEARATALSALRLIRETGTGWYVVSDAAAALARCASLSGEHAHALTLGAAARSVGSELGAISPAHDDVLRAAEAASRDVLDGETAARAVADGEAMSVDSLLEYLATPSPQASGK